MNIFTAIRHIYDVYITLWSISMRKAHIIIFSILLTNLGFSQDYNGTYKIDYIRSIEPTVSIDGTTDYEDTQKSISIGHGILEFDQTSITIHNFVEEATKVNIVSNRFQVNGTSLMIEHFNQDSVILRSENEKNTYLVLKPFKTESLEISDYDFRNSLWTLKSKTSGLNTVKFHFSDSSTVIISYRGQEFGYANFGEWRVLKSGKFHLLNVTDREFMNEYMFYSFSKSKDRIHVQFSEQETFGDEIPVRHNATIKRQNLISQKEYLKTERKLIGTWSFSGFENDISAYILDSINNIDFEMDFNANGSLETAKNISILIDGENKEYHNEESRSWTLSQDGSYIITHSKEDWTRYLSIYSIDKKTLILDLDFEYDERSSFQARIKLERKNRP